MAHRFDKKSILRRMHFKKPQKKTFSKNLFEFYRSAIIKTNEIFLGSFRLIFGSIMRHKLVFAGSMSMLIAAGIALYKPLPTGEEGLAQEDIIVIPDDEESQFIKFDETEFPGDSEVVDHSSDQDTEGDAPAFHSGSSVPGPELLATQPSSIQSQLTQPQTTLPKPVEHPKHVAKEQSQGAELIGIIETEDTGFDPARISNNPKSNQSVR